MPECNDNELRFNNLWSYVQAASYATYIGSTAFGKAIGILITLQFKGRSYLSN